MHPKNKLQHLLQVNKQKIPTYKYNCSGNKYISTVIFEINKKRFEIEGEIKTNKKETGKTAALNAYNYIISKNILANNLKYINKNNTNEIVLIDVENIGYKYINEKAKIIGFISKQHSLYSKINEIKNYMEIEVYNGLDKNGADTLMTFYIGKNLEYYIKNKFKITILSKDHFARCILTILKTYNIKCKIQEKI